jgi:hypothetical protein
MIPKNGGFVLNNIAVSSVTGLYSNDCLEYLDYVCSPQNGVLWRECRVVGAAGMNVPEVYL